MPNEQVSCVITCLRGNLHPMASLLRWTLSAKKLGSLDKLHSRNRHQPISWQVSSSRRTWRYCRSICCSGQDRKLRMRKSDQSFRRHRCSRSHLQDHWDLWTTHSALPVKLEIPAVHWAVRRGVSKSGPSVRATTNNSCNATPLKHTLVAYRH